MIHDHDVDYTYGVVPVSQVRVHAYKIPTESRESDGTLTWDSTSMVTVHLHAGGHIGFGYTYASVAAAIIIEDLLKPVIEGANVFGVPKLQADLILAVRNQGNAGLAMMAVSAVDVALWDLKAKLLNVSLAALLGNAHPEVLVYGSGGFTSYTDKQLQQQLSDWMTAGIQHVKIKVGQHPTLDPKRVAMARAAIGEKAHLFVDANGAYQVKQAIQQAEMFNEYAVTWFEEPVPAEDHEGLRFIREHVPASVSITGGEYGSTPAYFKRMVADQVVDILQADATRCGGISGFIKAGHIAEAGAIPFSSHCAPTLHISAAQALSSFYILEFFHDHVRIESMLFDGFIPPVNGKLNTDNSRPGLGVEFKHTDAAAFQHF